MSARKTAGSLRVYLEEGRKRTFALAVDWPGWARSGRTGEDALDALLSYRERYATSLATLGEVVPEVPDVTIVERVPGNATTDFGAPGVVPQLDEQPWPAPEARRQSRLLEATWACFDAVVARAPATLLKGPRGGGRDRDAIVDHVLSAEHAFRRKAGLRLPPPKDRAGHDQGRALLLAVLRGERTAADGSDVVTPAWPLPYATRRIAWHVLDHAWEIEDRAGG